MASPAPTTTPTLSDALRALGLRRTAEDLADFLARATRSRWSPAVLLEELVRAEAQDRARRSLERRLAHARLGRFKPMADFEWSWPKSLDRDAVERALALGFLASGSNVILAAAQGLGKTMIAKNVAHQAVLQGHSVLCVTAADLVLDLGGQETARALERRLRHYVEPRLLAVDEVGYVTYDNRAADLLFQVVSRRYEHRSILLTTNLAFKDWGTIFPNAACVTALIDRLTHHAEIITITGESYRRREAEAAQKARRANP
ncbi:MAG: ATP-binding protein [Deltaproteobacteria bacterium]|nr:ATP-binding protein [Deltaproteobacteria bacterium]